MRSVILLRLEVITVCFLLFILHQNIYYYFLRTRSKFFLSSVLEFISVTVVEF